MASGICTGNKTMTINFGIYGRIALGLWDAIYRV